MNHYLLSMPKRIDLSVNYRSHEKIINFVNETFSPHILNYVEQIPLKRTSLAVETYNPIKLHHLLFDSWDQSNKYVREENEIESVLVILKYILKTHPEDSLCVLYRKNSIGRRLLYHLLLEGSEVPDVRLVFSASEDPTYEIIRLFLWAIEDNLWKLNQEKFLTIEKTLKILLEISGLEDSSQLDLS